MLVYEVPIEEDVKITVEDSVIKVTGPKGELSRTFKDNNIKTELKENEGKIRKQNTIELPFIHFEIYSKVPKIASSVMY